MTTFKTHFHHLSDLLQSSEDLHWQQDWPVILTLCIVTIVTGPLCLLGWWMQHWNTTPVWDTEDHWAATKQAAQTFTGLAVVLTIVFLSVHPHLAAFWDLILWYGCCTLLAPLFALTAERLDPRTVGFQRIQLPSEHPPPPVLVEKPVASTTPSLIREAQPATTPPIRKKRPATKEPDRTAKSRKGRAVPLGDLLLQEKEEQKRRTTRAQEERPDTQVSLSPDSNTSSTPEPLLSPTPKSERRKPESLDHLF